MLDRDMRHVTVFVAQGCHLCDAALEVIEGVRAEVQFELEVVDITGEPELETRYRSEIPVVEIDGAHAFTYYVTAHGLRQALF